MQGYSVGVQGGWLSINDIHRLEDLPPVEGGDTYRVPLANVNLNAAELSSTEIKVKMANDMILAGFDPQETLKAFDLPVIPHSGVPSAKLQQVQNIDPAAPATVYEGN